MRAGAGRADPGLAGTALILVAGLAMAGAAGLCCGIKAYGPGEVWSALAGADAGEASTVIRAFRLPRVVIAPVAGAALAVAGILVQTLTRNRVASPDILGLNAGAAFAVVSAGVVLGVASLPVLALIAAAGAAVVGLVIYGIVAAAGALTPSRIVIAGATLASLLTALVEITLSLDEFALDRALFWLAGSFAERPLSLLAAAGPVILLGLALAAVLARTLDVMGADDETVRSLGVSVPLARLGVLVAVAALTGGTVAVAGPVGFVGLVVPQWARALAGERHGPRLAIGALAGAVFASVADLVARFVIFPREVPVGVVTGAVGAAFLVVLLRRRLV